MNDRILSIWLFVMLGTRCVVATDAPNLIFLLTDDQRYDTLGCTGNRFIKTPNLDRLASDGVLFTNASVNSAICTPSRACYFLGQYERRHGINLNSGTSLTPEAWSNSYPVLLRNTGYFTGYVGKNHVPVGPGGYFDPLIQNSFDFWYAAQGHLRFYPKEHHQIFRFARSETQTEILGDAAISFLDAQNDLIEGARCFVDSRPPDQPFCLSIAMNLPHGSSTGTMEKRETDPKLYRSAYRDQINRIELPPTYESRASVTTPKLPANVLRTEFRQGIYDYVDRPDTLRERLLRVAQTVTGIDRMIGGLRELLRKRGIAENTIIIFTSDHGIMAGEFGLGGKALNYEPCLRVPLIIMDSRQPSNRRGKRLDALVESVDIAPTLLEFAGIVPPTTMQGKSLRGLIDGSEVDVREASFAENLWCTYFGNPRIESVRTKRWKYIRYFQNNRERFAGVTRANAYHIRPKDISHYADSLTASLTGEQPVYEELFDLAEDPDERHNLIRDASYSPRLNELRKVCQQLLATAKGDPKSTPSTLVTPAVRAGQKKPSG